MISSDLDLKGWFSGNQKSIPWEPSHLIPLDRKYEAILCLFLLESCVPIGPVEELVEGMLEAGGKLARLGLGKPVALLAVRLGGH